MKSSNEIDNNNNGGDNTNNSLINCGYTVIDNLSYDSCNSNKKDEHCDGNCNIKNSNNDNNEVEINNNDKNLSNNTEEYDYNNNYKDKTNSANNDYINTEKDYMHDFEKKSSCGADEFIEKNNYIPVQRKSSVALFIPPFMMERTNGSIQNSQADSFLKENNFDESLFEIDFPFSGENYSNKYAERNDKNIEKNISLLKKNDEIVKNFYSSSTDKLLDIDECQNADKINNLFMFSNSDNNEIIQSNDILLDKNSNFVINEGPLTLDCIRVSEAMNDALEIMTFQRNSDIDPFCMKIKDTTLKYKEKIEYLQKQFNTKTREEFKSIKNNHKINLKAFKEKESIIHYKLNEIDSSMLQMNKRIEHVQSFLRNEIHKNRTFLEKKINELRETLKYAS